MIDIHTHILPFVDDGCKTEEQAISLLKEEETFGVTDVILTPHYHLADYNKTVQDITKAFEDFKEKASKVTNIKLHLGFEIYDDGLLKEENIDAFSIANSEYFLQELPLQNSAENLNEILYLYKKQGKKIVLAHVERYDLGKDLLLALKERVFIQVNASTVIGKGLFKENKITKWLLKNDLVDFVASDIHYNRDNNLKKAYDFVEKKYGKDRAERLFNLNAREFLLK
ncbi:MAG: hypothetical protein E7342_05100 [Clostridiales bacterium]|nr:hypothetical protein [Clostridiales bacterium]